MKTKTMEINNKRCRMYNKQEKELMVLGRIYKKILELEEEGRKLVRDNEI